MIMKIKDFYYVFISQYSSSDDSKDFANSMTLPVQLVNPVAEDIYNAIMWERHLLFLSFIYLLATPCGLWDFSF